MSSNQNVIQVVLQVLYQQEDLKTFVKNVTQNAQFALIKTLLNALPALPATLSNLVHLNVWNLKIVFQDIMEM